MNCLIPILYERKDDVSRMSLGYKSFLLFTLNAKLISVNIVSMLDNFNSQTAPNTDLTFEHIYSRNHLNTESPV